MRVFAVDWSGAQSGAASKIWLAEVAGGRLRRLESGRDREALTRHLIEEAEEDPDLVVGLDFAFSFPLWYLQQRGLDSVRELWALAATEGESWLRGCEPPFWGKPGRRRPDQEAFRRTELDVKRLYSARPKSAFQIGGGGAVGAMSVRGMPFLNTLTEAGFNVWPFDPPDPPLVLEIYPRLFTGPLVKSSIHARRRHLRGHLPEIDAHHRQLAERSEDAFDAAVCTVVMARHAVGIRSLPPARDDYERLEGRIWHLPEGAGRSLRQGGATTLEASVGEGCLFCDLDSSRVTVSSAQAVAFRDAYPVSRGHTCVIPLRHVARLSDLTSEEEAALWALAREVRTKLAAAHDPDGFNIGVNDGEAAGQTIGHAHVHVIPRYEGDVADPRGGIRWVVPDRAPYWDDR